MGPHSSQNSPHARVKWAEDRPSTMPPRACEGGKGVRGGVRERVDMRQGDEGGMEGGTTGLRGVACSGRDVHTWVAEGRWRVDDRPPWTTPVGKCSKEAVAGEGVAVAPRPPQESVSYAVGGACSLRREVNERVLAAPVRILVFTPADEMERGYRADRN